MADDAVELVARLVYDSAIADGRPRLLVQLSDRSPTVLLSAIALVDIDRSGTKRSAIDALSALQQALDIIQLNR